MLESHLTATPRWRRTRLSVHFVTGRRQPSALPTHLEALGASGQRRGAPFPSRADPLTPHPRGAQQAAPHPWPVGSRAEPSPTAVNGCYRPLTAARARCPSPAAGAVPGGPPWRREPTPGTRQPAAPPAPPRLPPRRVIGARRDSPAAAGGGQRAPPRPARPLRRRRLRRRLRGLREGEERSVRHRAAPPAALSSTP